MRLPLGKFLPKKEKSDYLLALLLRDDKASAVIVEQESGKIKVIGSHSVPFTTSLEDASTDEFLEVLDKVISKAEETLPPNVETTKTIYGVKDEWVEEKKIKKEHLSRLKKVSEPLDLTPVGFLVISEAVAHLVEEEEGAPLSAIVADVGKKTVNLVLYRGGKVVDTQNGPIEDSPMHTVDRLLKHFTVEVLPSRIILCNGEDDKNLLQKFITHQWSKSLPFLHVPQISVLPEDFVARSIVFGAATQMGFEVLGEVVDKTAGEIKTYEHGDKTTVQQPDTEEEVKAAIEKNDEVDEGRAGDEKKTEEKNSSEEEELMEDDTPPIAGDNFGFVKEEDIEKIRPKTPSKEETFSHEEQVASRIVDQDEESDKPSPFSILTAKLSIISGMLPHLPRILKKTVGPLAKVKGNKLLLIPLGILILLIGLSILYTRMAQATITLNLNPRVVDEAEEVTFSPEAVNDFSIPTLQAEAVTSSIEGTVSTNATGKKDIGEKAKGTVTLYNSNDARKQLNAGATITSSNNLDYVLDKDVAVASASGNIFTGTKPGTAQAAVTAKNIGPDYNLPSNATFTIPGVANMAGKNDSAFSGGSKKQVTVVAKKDTDKLLADLPKSLQEKAQEDLKNKVDSEAGLLPGFIDTTIASRKFDKEVDAEAKTVTLRGKVTFEALTYKKKDLQDFATTVLKNKYSEELEVSDKGITTEITESKLGDEGEVTASVAIKANLLPTLNTDDIRKNLAGKSKSDAEKYLKSLPQISTAEISLSPPLPFIPQFIPKALDHVKVEVKENE